MTYSNASSDVQVFSVPLQSQGQITVPLALQDQLNLAEGDHLTLLKIGDIVLLAPQSLKVPQLTEQIAATREAAGVSLSTLLNALQAERQMIWDSHQSDA